MPYRFGDLVVASNVELPELLPADDAAAEVHFELREAGALGPPGVSWFHHHLTPGGRLFLSFARQGSNYLLRFADMADFLLSAHGAEASCYPVPGLPAATMRHLLLDQVLPMVLSQRGRLVLHASAVAHPEGAVAFLGESGRGKSTLAAYLAGQGHPLLTDDCLILRERPDGLAVIPSYPGIRLRPEVIPALFGEQFPSLPVAHYTMKQRVGSDNAALTFTGAAFALRRLYVLPSPEETVDKGRVAITPLPFREAVVQLAQASFQLDCRDRAALRTAFETQGRVARLGLICRLTYPRDLEQLGAIYEAIRLDLRSCNGERTQGQPAKPG